MKAGDLIWNTGNVVIPGILNVSHNEQLVVHGTAQARLKVEGWTEEQTVFWDAWVTPRGWAVKVYERTGRITQYEGPTFNMALEVAAAVRQAGGF